MANEKGDQQNPLYTKVLGTGRTEFTDWATESTLSIISKNSEVAAKLLASMGKSMSSNVKEIDKLSNSIAEGTGKFGDAIKDTLKDLSKEERKRALDKARKEDDELEQQLRKDREVREKARRRENMIDHAKADLAIGLLGIHRTINNTAISQTDVLHTVKSSVSSISLFVGSILGLIPIIGKAATVLTVGLAGILTLPLEAGLHTAKTYQTLSETGIVFNQGMFGMISAANLAGQTVEQMAHQIAKFSGIATTLGSKTLVELGKQFADVGYRFDLSSDDSREFLMNYLTMLRTQGLLQFKTNDQLINESTKYLGILTEVSRLTGISRRQQQEELNKVLTESYIKAAL